MSDAEAKKQEGFDQPQRKAGYKIIQIAADDGTLFILTDTGQIAFTTLDGNSIKPDQWRIVDLPALGVNMQDSTGGLTGISSDSEE
ncbi:MAG TPA: hypothetical protein VLE99_06195 [Candidatus Saccharimonadales bacterium]|nr:hypothetical protein [Candidatus Saccharimonadales bacterium]